MKNKTIGVILVILVCVYWLGFIYLMLRPYPTYKSYDNEIELPKSININDYKGCVLIRREWKDNNTYVHYFRRGDSVWSEVHSNLFGQYFEGDSIK